MQGASFYRMTLDKVTKHVLYAGNGENIKKKQTDSALILWAIKERKGKAHEAFNITLL